jgi:hypothetical protein
LRESSGRISYNAKATGQPAKPDYAAGGQYGYGLVDAKASLDFLLGR